MLWSKFWSCWFKYWLQNTDNNCLQYLTTVALNHEETESHPEWVSVMKPFIDKYNWKVINYPSKTDTLYTKEKEICPAYISKINSNCVKQIILLKTPNEEKEGIW